MSPTGRALRTETEDDPSAVSAEQEVKTVRTVDPSDYPDLVEAIENILGANLDRATDVIAAIAPDLDADEAAIRIATMRTLVTVAESDPDAVVSALPSITARVDDLAAVLDRERCTYVRHHLLDAFAAIGADHPRAGTPAIDPCARILADSPTPALAARASWTLGSLAEADSAAVADAVSEELPAIVDGLPSEDDGLVEGSAALLSSVAEHEPTGVEPALRAPETSSRPTLRNSREWAVWILAFAGEEADRDRLEAVERADPHEVVRAAAAEATDVLAPRVG